MRYGSGHKQESRLRILAAAARRFRERGFASAGVDEVMRAAGLTAGAFYAHFASKQELVAQAFAHALEQSHRLLVGGLEDRQGTAWVAELVRRYLSRAHRDAIAEGCPLPALAAEVGRQDDGTRQVFEAYLRRLLEDIRARAPEVPGDRALALIALCVGGVTLSRSVTDRALADRILLACRRMATQEIP